MVHICIFHQLFQNPILRHSTINPDLLIFFISRRVQLLVSGPGLQASVFLLHDHHLRAGMHAGHSIMVNKTKHRDRSLS